MGAPICQDCHKLCSLDTEEPELQSSDIQVTEDEVTKTTEVCITGEIRIVRLSACCGTETKEYTFEAEEQVTVEGHFGEGHDISLEDGDLDLIEEGGSRYAKSYIGFTWSPELTCECGQPVELSGEPISITDKVQASAFDELY